MKSLLILFTFLSLLTIQAQELNCEVSISNVAQIQNVTPETYKNLETAIREFMNNTKWTNDKYSNVEKIDCSVAITIKEELSATAFSAEAIIQCGRPIFNSTYNSNLFTFRDQAFSFSWTDGEPIIYSDGAFTSGLSALLSFYAYYILAIDYDSFGMLAGTALYEKARDIAILSESNLPGSGWGQRDGDFSRFHLTNSILTSTHDPLRKFSYEYHRLGLDVMAKEQAKAKNKIHLAFKKIEQVNNSDPRSILIQILFNSKVDEFANVLTEFPDDKKNQSIELLSKLDVRNKNKYQKAKK